MKKIFWFLFFLCFLISSNSFAAKPFVAPVNFDLDGSNIEFQMTFETQKLHKSYEASLNPNPAPVTGRIEIEKLNQDSGVFSGFFREITATTTVSNVPGLSEVKVGIEINGYTTGIFLWNENKVVFSPVYLNADISISGNVFHVLLANVPIRATYNNERMTLDFEINKQGEYANFNFDLSAKVHLVGQMQKPDNANNGLWIKLSTNDAVYNEGENFKLFASLGNSGETKNIDLYIILEDNGKYYSFPYYGEGFTPVLQNYRFNSGLYALNIKLHDANLPTITPPINHPGKFTYYAVFTEPHTTKILGVIESTVFNYEENVGSGTYDGIWEGTAVSNVHTDFCEGDAHVIFNIVSNRIDGTASMFDDEYTATGFVDSQGKIVDGVIWDDAPIGTFDGHVDGKRMSGTWVDQYGCFGTFEMTKK
jgi:hypothetical protein